MHDGFETVRAGLSTSSVGSVVNASNGNSAVAVVRLYVFIAESSAFCPAVTTASPFLMGRGNVR